MKETVNYIITFVNLMILIRYCWLIYHKRITPSLAMWSFFFVAILLSMITYLSKDNYSWSDNILNATDIILTGSISIFILFFGKKESRFNRFDLGCLITVLLIVLFWIISKEHFVSNIATQVILVIAYFPVVRRMLILKENTESISIWIAMFSAPLLSLTCSEGVLASIYLYRSAFCSGLLLILMLRTQYIHERKKVKTD